MKGAGIEFRVCEARVRELTQAQMPGLSPGKLVLHNACLKGLSVSKRFPQHYVLAADTIVVLGKDVLGKPKTMTEARKMLQWLSGRKHKVITAVAFCLNGRIKFSFQEVSEVYFRRLTELKIAKYLSKINPLDKAGGYAAQEFPEWVIRKIKGSRSNVVGIPVEKVLIELQRIGIGV
jgi:septum formation protein